MVVPGRAAPPSEPRVVPAVAITSANQSPCDALVAEGVRLAQAGDYAGSERALTSALACPGERGVSRAGRPARAAEALERRRVAGRYRHGDRRRRRATPGACSPPRASCWTIATARSRRSTRRASRRWTPCRSPGCAARAPRSSSDAIDVERGEMLTTGALNRARRRLDRRAGAALGHARVRADARAGAPKCAPR